MASRWSHVRPSFHVPDHYPIPAKTGPLDSLHSSNVLVLADWENLLLGARQLNCQLSLASLASRLRLTTKSVRLLGFISTIPHEQQAPVELGDVTGWEVIANYDDVDHSSRSRRPSDSWAQLRNSDNLILFRAGTLIESYPCDTVVIGSGDGTLVCSLARFIRDISAAKRLMTLSVSGSTSRRILTRRNPHVAANIFLGFDCLTPQH